MERFSSYIRTLVIILVLALPALTIKYLSTRNDDLSLLPLAPSNDTQSSLFSKGEQDDRAQIDVLVNWPKNWNGAMTKEALKERISTPLKHQTRFYNIEFSDHAGSQIDVTFVVGPNIYGPFKPSQIANGIEPALIALRMSRGPENY